MCVLRLNFLRLRAHHGGGRACAKVSQALDDRAREASAVGRSPARGAVHAVLQPVGDAAHVEGRHRNAAQAASGRRGRRSGQRLGKTSRSHSRGGRRAARAEPQTHELALEARALLSRLRCFPLPARAVGAVAREVTRTGRPSSATIPAERRFTSGRLSGNPCDQEEQSVMSPLGLQCRTPARSREGAGRDSLPGSRTPVR